MRMKAPEEEPVTLAYVDMKAQTEKAFLLIFEVDGERRDEWIPRSQVVLHDTVSKAISVKPWIARQKGLIA